MNVNNNAVLIGNLGKDPEVKHLESGSIVANFSLATSKKFKNKSGEMQEQTQWHNLVCWNKTAEIAEKYLKKGSKIAAAGEIQYRSYDDKDGNKRYVTEINLETFQMLDSKGSGGSNAQAEASASKPSKAAAKPAQEAEDDDDLPF
jgi:single-strand DNA-binding protein